MNTPTPVAGQRTPLEPAVQNLLGRLQDRMGEQVKNMPEEDRRALGLKILKREMLRSIGVDIDQGGPYNDTMTDQELERWLEKGNQNHKNLKAWEHWMEQQLKNFPGGYQHEDPAEYMSTSKA